MAHFKLHSVDIDEMFGTNPGTYEYICGKNDKEKKYTRFSGPMGGFDVFNLKCVKKEDYKRANWIIEELNKKYKDKECPSKAELEHYVVNLYANYKRVKTLMREIQSSQPSSPLGI